MVHPDAAPQQSLAEGTSPSGISPRRGSPDAPTAAPQAGPPGEGNPASPGYSHRQTRSARDDPPGLGADTTDNQPPTPPLAEIANRGNRFGGPPLDGERLPQPARNAERFLSLRETPHSPHWLFPGTVPCRQTRTALAYRAACRRRPRPPPRRRTRRPAGASTSAARPQSPRATSRTTRYRQARNQPAQSERTTKPGLARRVTAPESSQLRGPRHATVGLGAALGQPPPCGPASRSVRPVIGILPLRSHRLHTRNAAHRQQGKLRPERPVLLKAANM